MGACVNYVAFARRDIISKHKTIIDSYRLTCTILQKPREEPLDQVLDRIRVVALATDVRANRMPVGTAERPTPHGLRPFRVFARPVPGSSGSSRTAAVWAWTGAGSPAITRAQELDQSRDRAVVNHVAQTLMRGARRRASPDRLALSPNSINTPTDNPTAEKRFSRPTRAEADRRRSQR